MFEGPEMQTPLTPAIMIWRWVGVALVILIGYWMHRLFFYAADRVIDKVEEERAERFSQMIATKEELPSEATVEDQNPEDGDGKPSE